MSKIFTQMDVPDRFCCASRGQSTQHHATGKHADAHQRMEQQMFQGPGGARHPATPNARAQTALSTAYAPGRQKQCCILSLAWMDSVLELMAGTPVRCCGCRGERSMAWRWSHKPWRNQHNAFRELPPHFRPQCRGTQCAGSERPTHHECGRSKSTRATHELCA